MPWLLEASEPAVRYLASRDLLVPRPSTSGLRELRSVIPRAGWVAAILSRQREATWWERKDTAYWPKVNGTYWCVAVLADLGLTREDARMANAVEHMLRLHLAPDGGFSPWGPTWPSHFCSTGIMLRILVEAGYLDDPRTERAIGWLLEAQLEDGGWECHPARTGTLDAWEALAAFAAIPAAHRSREVRESVARAAEFYLERRLLHEGPPYPRWTQLHFPWHYWYDVLVGLDCLTRLGFGADPRMREALTLLRSKRQRDGRWTIEGTNGNLRLEAPGKPSKMATFLALRIFRRVAEARAASSSVRRPTRSSRRADGTRSRGGSTR